MPKTFTPEQRVSIIEKVVAGLRIGTPLTVLCSAKDMPCDDTVRIWASEDAALGREIARARDAGFDTIALDALRIADTPLIGETVTEKPLVVDGKPLDGVTVREVRTDDMLGHRKLQVETRLKLLAKWDPKRYGELMKHAGPNGDDPVQSNVTVSFVKTDKA